MRSVRIDPELEARVVQAATARGESVSEFIRRAVAQRADETPPARGRAAFADVAGTIRSGGGLAERTGEAFIETLLDARRKR